MAYRDDILGKDMPSHLSVLCTKTPIIGIALIAVGIIFLSFSIPMIMANTAFTAYDYEGGNPQIDQLLDLVAAGALLLPFGIILLFKSRRRINS